MTAEPIILSDLGSSQPAEAVSTAPRRGRWRAVPYRSDTFRGTMLVAADATNAPEVRFTHGQTGWHRISFGVLDHWDEITMFEVKLAGDAAFCVIAAPGQRHPAFHEVYWKTAEVTGQDLVFRQFGSTWGQPEDAGDVRFPASRARIAYVRLDPLSAEDVAAFLADQRQPAHKRLYGHNDTTGFMWLTSVRGPDEVRRDLEPFREGDFSRIYWEAAMGDILFYPGRTGRLPTSDGVEDFQHTGDHIFAENWRRYRDTGFDMLREAVDTTHGLGLEIHAGYRPAGFYFPYPEDTWNAGVFYERHPELRAVNHDGSLAPRISYTFPETRRYVLTVLREVAEYGVDGIALIYIRRPPLIGWEAPLVEAFRAETGLDAHALAADDERWLRFRCRVLDEFMRELRAELDDVGRALGRSKPIAITAMVSGRWEENLRHGMDVARWVADGTVDTLIPYTMAPALDSLMDGWPDPAAVEPWVDVVRGTKTNLSVSVMPRWKSPNDYRRVAQALYARGVESLFFWDCGGQRVNFMDQYAWNAMRRLGHREEVLAWQDPGPEPPEFAAMPHVTMLGIPVGVPGPDEPLRPALEIGNYDLAFGTPG